MSDIQLMNRGAFLSELRQYAKANNLTFEWVKGKGKGSHGRVYVGGKFTTVKAGEIGKIMKEVMLKQLGIDKTAF